MRILWLSHLVPYPPKGGVLQRSHHLFVEIAKYHDMDLLAFNQEDLMAPLFPNDDNFGLAEAEEALKPSCNKIKFVEINSDKQAFGNYRLALKSLLTRDPYNINWLKSKKFSAILNEWAASENYDLVHYDTISLIPYLSTFATTAKSLDHHNIESHMLFRRAENETNPLKKAYFWQEGKRIEQAEQKYCPQFDINITCSDIDTQRLKEISPESKVTTIPNGVDTDFFSTRQAPELPNSLIFVGTLSWYPNAEAVLFIAEQLWETLSNQIPDITIDIIGANPPKALLAAAEKFKNFNVHGFVDDIRPYIDRASLYVCPISDGGGTKLKILDAFAMSKAVVAHPIACEGIDVTPDKNVAYASTVEEYVQQIKSLLKNPEQRQQLGTNARKLVEDKYSYASIGKTLSDTLQACTS